MLPKTAVLKALLLTRFTALVLIGNVNSKLLQAKEWSANASDHPTNKAVEKAIVDKGLGKKHGQYFIFSFASSFVVFHAA